MIILAKKVCRLTLHAIDSKGIIHGFNMYKSLIHSIHVTLQILHRISVKFPDNTDKQDFTFEDT